MNNLPSTHVYSLNDVGIEMRDTIINLSDIVINQLANKHVSAIMNAFTHGVRINNNGAIFIAISYLHTLLRTEPGAANRMWQDGISSYVSGADSHTIDNDLYISGPDFIGLVDARSQLSYGKTKLYLQYIQAAYYALTSHALITDIRTTFAHSIETMRSKLKKERISKFSIRHCEFSGIEFFNDSQVEFAHIVSVSTNPDTALDINNGVIILKEYHRELTRRKIHNREGMYNYCEENNFSLEWARR